MWIGFGASLRSTIAAVRRPKRSQHSRQSRLRAGHTRERLDED